MIDNDELAARVSDFLVDHDPRAIDSLAFLRARFDAGLAWVHYPAGLGGLGADPSLQPGVDHAFAAAGAPDNKPHTNIVGLGIAAPTLLRFGTPDQQRRWLRPLWTGEEIWCQLFSEPGAGSDLADVATIARRYHEGWIVNGHKVWTSLAHNATWAILVARTDPAQPKHRGLTFFVCDMRIDGVDVRPVRQITGESEFNEVHLDNVCIPDAQRLGEVGRGWALTQFTLMNERIAIGAATIPRESGAIGDLAKLWRERPELRRSGQHDQVLRLWVEAEAARLTAERLGQQQKAGQPGPEGSGAKLSYARLNQQISAVELDLLGGEGLLHSSYSARRPGMVDHAESPAGWRYLRASGDSIEGSTSEIMRNIIAERVLGLPPEPRADLLYSEIEDDLRATVRALLQKCSPWDAVLARTESSRPTDLALYATLARELGCAALAVPEERGGAGASWREVAVIAEELGRAVAPVPFLGVSVAVALLLELGEQELLAELVAGDALAVVAVPFAAGPSTWTSSLEADGDVLNGTVLGVADAYAADVLVVYAGDALYVVRARAAGLQRIPVASLDMTRPLIDLSFDDTTARLLARGPAAAAAVDAALRVGAVLLASEQLGVAERCWEMAVEHLRTRRQFGRILGSFQALKHRMADLWVLIAQARAVARYAAECAATGSDDLAVAAALAQAHCSVVVQQSAEECLQLHGGIGFRWDHPAHLYLKRAKSSAIALGTAERHRAALAELLDLPGA